MVGDMLDRGRLPGATRLGAGRPRHSGRKEKSVSWLFNRKPRTIRREPKALSTVVVKETAFPKRSTMLICAVDRPLSGSPGPG